jgi:hypothetical protein
MEKENIQLTENNNAYKSAKHKTEKLKEFYQHLFTYTLINSILFLVNILSDPYELWILFPIIGWGICLTIHGLDTFSIVNSIGDNWEERKIKELMKKVSN